MAVGNRPPIGPVTLNRQSPQAKNLKSAGIITSGRNNTTIVYDVANDVTYSPYSNAPDLGTGEFGTILRFNVGGRNTETLIAEYLNDLFDGAPSATLMVLARFNGTDSTDEDTLIGQWSGLQGSSDNNAKRIFMRYDSTANELESFVNAGAEVGSSGSCSIEDGEFHWLVTHYDGATISSWVDGVVVGTPAAVTGSISSAANSKRPEIMGGHAVTQGGADAPRFDLKAWGIWAPCLPGGLIPSLSAPQTRWDLYQQPRSIHFGVPAAVAAAGGLLPMMNHHGLHTGVSV